MVHGSLGHNDFHDGFAEAGAGSRARRGIGVATTADEGRIANAARKFAARAPSGSGGVEPAFAIESDSADGALFMAAVKFGSMRILAAFEIGIPFGFADKLFGTAEEEALVFDEAFGAFADEHHVRAFFENRASGANGILDSLQGRGRTGTKGGSVHHDGIAFHLAIKIQVRTITGIEDGIVFEDDNRCFDGIESMAAGREDRPSGRQGIATTLITNIHRFIRNIPGTTMNDQSRLHGEENRRGRKFCPRRTGSKVLDEKIEKKKKRSEAQKYHAAIDLAAGNTAKFPQKPDVREPKSGFFTQSGAVAGDRVTDNLAANCAEFIVKPNGEVLAVEPKKRGAINKDDIAQNRQDPKGRPDAPRHKSSH